MAPVTQLLDKSIYHSEDTGFGVLPKLRSTPLKRH